jgi:hypothetical protein
MTKVGCVTLDDTVRPVSFKTKRVSGSLALGNRYNRKITILAAVDFSAAETVRICAYRPAVGISCSGPRIPRVVVHRFRRRLNVATIELG